MVLRKSLAYTTITPIPGFIPRQLAIDILHSHSEVITLNPLVLHHKPIKAPRDAASDEYYLTWYEISQQIQYIPGIGKIGSGKINFNGCFHDLPWGLQTHTYAPANVDIRITYRVAGNQPGVEPPEQQEIGLNAPSDGLYLREDIRLACNFAMVSFVKSQLKAASKEMVDRIIKKAELLDAGALHAMIEDGKLKTINPNDRSYTGGLAGSASMSPPRSPASMDHQSNAHMSPKIPYQIPRPLSLRNQQSYQQQQNSRPGTAGSQYTGHPYFQPQIQKPGEVHQQANELPTSNPSGTEAVIMELPGDFYHPQDSPHLHPSRLSPSLGSHNSSSVSTPEPNSWRWSQSQHSPGFQNNSRPTSMLSDTSSNGFQSPGMDHKGFASELSTHQETHEEYQHQNSNKKDSKTHSQPNSYSYNPADYARVGHR
ncbi:uncharacterized protein BCR38DRAFT_338755 [Pseudomassariella vexata]|uniref:DUF7053 domain-containing protein n=1 Tax=Pseudomassariella vexata TaxID=1141098 RepID=A0A1Y2E3T7_9PEZI|nr:uncharacterized protein BCR38DRAFT_338755 [Pseudomassariella vexata]ORY66107.1 hypothetical protein BCR38DRAFT_338755 [Pseudomassariella vexata]